MLDAFELADTSSIDRDCVSSKYSLCDPTGNAAICRSYGVVGGYIRLCNTITHKTKQNKTRIKFKI